MSVRGSLSAVWKRISVPLKLSRKKTNVEGEKKTLTVLINGEEPIVMRLIGATTMRLGGHKVFATVASAEGKFNGQGQEDQTGKRSVGFIRHPGWPK